MCRLRVPFEHCHWICVYKEIKLFIAKYYASRNHANLLASSRSRMEEGTIFKVLINLSFQQNLLRNGISQGLLAVGFKIS